MASRCASCNLRGVCLPRAVPAEDDARLERLVYARRRVRPGETLFRCGDRFASLYAVHGGFFKTEASSGDGRERVTGFFMAGELLGLDGIGTGKYHVSAVALTEGIVCVMPFALVQELSREVPALQRELHGALSREIVRDHEVMMMLASMRAEERLAAFLVNLSLRFRRRGYSPWEFNLHMTREEIGSYLGLSVETVSRLFTRFQEQGMVALRHRQVRLVDPDRLRALAEAA